MYTRKLANSPSKAESKCDAVKNLPQKMHQHCEMTVIRVRAKVPMLGLISGTSVTCHMPMRTLRPKVG